MITLMSNRDRLVEVSNGPESLVTLHSNQSFRSMKAVRKLRMLLLVEMWMLEKNM